MLLLVGLGLGEAEISTRALAAVKSADIVMCERYTSIVSDSYVGMLEKECGKKIVMLERRDLEDNLKETIGAAATKKLALLVPGDPLIATTHHILLDAASKMGIQCKIFHSSSIFSAAIGESGLDIYKFGPTTTIPMWGEKYKPTSFLDVIAKNMQNGQHTLVLLDFMGGANRSMGIEVALKTLKDADAASGRGIITQGLKIIALVDVGSDSQKIKYAELQLIEKSAATLNGNAACLIVPAELNFAEEESLKRFAQPI